MQKLKPHFKTFLNKKWRFSVSIFLGSFLLVMLAFIAKQTISVSPIIVNGDTVTINSNANIGHNTTYDGKNLIITNSAIVTMDGEHSFNNVTLKDTSTLTHTAVNRMGGVPKNANNWTAKWTGYLDLTNVKDINGVPVQPDLVGLESNNGARIYIYDPDTNELMCKTPKAGTAFYATSAYKYINYESKWDNTYDYTLGSGGINCGYLNQDKTAAMPFPKKIYKIEIHYVEGSDNYGKIYLHFGNWVVNTSDYLYINRDRSEGECISEKDSTVKEKGIKGLCGHYYEKVDGTVNGQPEYKVDPFNLTKNSLTRIDKEIYLLWASAYKEGWNDPAQYIKDSPFIGRGGLKLNVAGDFKMENNATINVSSKGYQGGNRTDKKFKLIDNFYINYENGAGPGSGLRNDQHDTHVGAGGGGYGGCGGAGNDDNSITHPKPPICLQQRSSMRNDLKGISNGIIENPINHGSGGGYSIQTSGSATGIYGGNGGGLVNITANNVILQDQSQILAFGQNGGKADGTSGGGGAGGTINLTVKNNYQNNSINSNKPPHVLGGIGGSENEGDIGENGTIYTNISGFTENNLGGNLFANGGSGGIYDGARGGGGGGGRIAIVKVLDDPIVSINKEIIDGENRLATSSDKDGVMIKFKINFVTNNVQGPVEIKDQWTNLLSDVKLGITSEGVTAQINQSNNTITATYTGTGASDQIGFIEFSGKITTKVTADCGKLINKPPSITYTHNGAQVSVSGVGITIFCNIVTGDIYGGSVSVNKDKLQIDKSSVVTSAGTIGYNGELDKTFESTKITTWTTFTEDLKAQINDALKNTAIESSVNSDIWFLNAGGTLSSSRGKINNKNGLWKAQENSIGSQEKSFSGSGTIINKEEVNTVNITKSITKNNNSQLGLVFPENTTTINITPSDTQTLDTSILAPWAEVKIIVGAGKKLFFTGVIIANKITVEIQGSGSNMGVLYMQYDPAISANPLPLFANALKYTQFEAIR